MKTLRFIVQDNTILQDPFCRDFEGLFPGDNDDIKAEFVFSSEWKRRKKVVAFWSMLDKEYPPRILNDDNTCDIPEEALSRPAFKIQILGKFRGHTYETDTITIYQRGGMR